MGADKFLTRSGRKQDTATEFLVSLILFIIIIGGILVLNVTHTNKCTNRISCISLKLFTLKTLKMLLHVSIA